MQHTVKDGDAHRIATEPEERMINRVAALEAALRRLVFAAKYCPDANWREVARDDIVAAEWLLNNPEE